MIQRRSQNGNPEVGEEGYCLYPFLMWRLEAGSALFCGSIGRRRRLCFGVGCFRWLGFFFWACNSSHSEKSISQTKTIWGWIFQTQWAAWSLSQSLGPGQCQQASSFPWTHQLLGRQQHQAAGARGRRRQRVAELAPHKPGSLHLPLELLCISYLLIRVCRHPLSPGPCCCLQRPPSWGEGLQRPPSWGKGLPPSFPFLSPHRVTLGDSALVVPNHFSVIQVPQHNC